VVTIRQQKKQEAKKLSPQEIVAGFQKLREEQRAIVVQIQRLEMDRNEHQLVLNTLKEVDENRKCFRMLNGILIERKVSEVVPALQRNIEQFTNAIGKLKEQLTLKGNDLSEYREKHGIRFQSELVDDEKEEQQQNDSKPTKNPEEKSTSEAEPPQTSGVVLSQ